MGPPCFIQKLYPSNNAKLIPWINATQTHSINNYQSISKSLGVIRWEIDISDDKSTFNELEAILIQNTMENGERKEMKFHAFTEKKVQKMIALLFW